MATLTLPRFAAGSKDVDGAGTGQASFACAEAVKERALRALAWTKRLCVKHSLPLGFLIGLIWAIVWPEPGKAMASVVVGKSGHDPRGIRLFEFICNVNIFLVSGLTLRTGDFRGLMQKWKAPAYGLLTVLVMTPLLALGLKVLPFAQHEFSIGLAIFSVVPTTLGAGVAFTQVAHGNSALALFLTVATNLLAVVTVPFLLRPLLAGDSMIHIHPGILIGKLTAAVLAPTLLGMAIRASHVRVREWIVRRKTALGLFCTVNLVAIVWQTLSSAHGALLRQSGATLALVAVAAILQHFAYLAFNFLMATTVVRLPPPEVVTVVIMGSMKTVTWAVSVITNVTDDPAQQGLFIIPCLLGQNAQIFINSMLAPRMAAWVDKKAAAAAAAAATADASIEGGEGEGESVEIDDLEAGTRMVVVVKDEEEGRLEHEWVVVDAVPAVPSVVAVETKQLEQGPPRGGGSEEKEEVVMVAEAEPEGDGEKSEAAVDAVVTQQEQEAAASAAAPSIAPVAVEGEEQEVVAVVPLASEVAAPLAAAQEEERPVDEEAEAAASVAPTGAAVAEQEEQPAEQGTTSEAVAAEEESVSAVSGDSLPAPEAVVAAVEAQQELRPAANEKEEGKGDGAAASALGEGKEEAVVAEMGAAERDASVDLAPAPAVSVDAVEAVQQQQKPPKEDHAEANGVVATEAAAVDEDDDDQAELGDVKDSKDAPAATGPGTGARRKRRRRRGKGGQKKKEMAQ